MLLTKKTDNQKLENGTYLFCKESSQEDLIDWIRVYFCYMRSQLRMRLIQEILMVLLNRNYEDRTRKKK